MSGDHYRYIAEFTEYDETQEEAVENCFAARPLLEDLQRGHGRRDGRACSGALGPARTRAELYGVPL